MKTKNNTLKNNEKLLNFILLFLFLILIILNSKISVISVKNALVMWADNVLPSLFPFMFFTSLLFFGGYGVILNNSVGKLFNKIFNAPLESGYIFLMSALCGYPMCAKISGDYFSQNILTEQDVTKISSFSSVSGPVFILGTVGLCFFNNINIGIKLFIIHILSAVITGIIFRHKFKNNGKINIKNEKLNINVIYMAMNSACISIIMVGGYIVIFSMIIDLMLSFESVNFSLAKISQFTYIDFKLIRAVFSGLIEMTRGLRELSLLDLNEKTTLAIASFMLSFGGLSVFLQSISFYLNGIKKKWFFLFKITQALVATLIALAF